MNQKKHKAQIEALDERIKELEQHAIKPFIPKEKRNKEVIFYCPGCSEPMSYGRLKVHTGWWVRLLNPLRWPVEHLWFHPNDNTVEFKVIGSWESKMGFHCQNCKSTWIPGGRI